MLVGYNTNISYKNKIYHIQTEDNGLNNPVIVTFLYFQGAIIASKKTVYSNLIDDPEFKDKVTRLMKKQHKEMIKELFSGKYERENKEDRIDENPPQSKNPQEIEAPEKMKNSLDDVLINYIMKRAR